MCTVVLTVLTMYKELEPVGMSKKDVEILKFRGKGLVHFQVGACGYITVFQKIFTCVVVCYSTVACVSIRNDNLHSS